MKISRCDEGDGDSSCDLVGGGDCVDFMVAFKELLLSILYFSRLLCDVSPVTFLSFRRWRC